MPIIIIPHHKMQDTLYENNYFPIEVSMLPNQLLCSYYLMVNTQLNAAKGVGKGTKGSVFMCHEP